MSTGSQALAAGRLYTVACDAAGVYWLIADDDARDWLKLEPGVQLAVTAIVLRPATTSPPRPPARQRSSGG